MTILYQKIVCIIQHYLSTSNGSICNHKQYLILQPNNKLLILYDKYPIPIPPELTKIPIFFLLQPIVLPLQLNITPINFTKMKKVLAVLSVRPEYIQFAIPQLKSLLSKLQIPFTTLFEQSIPLPQNNYQITHRNVKNFPYVTLTIPDFDLHRTYFQQASKKAVMTSKFILLLSHGHTYQQLLLNKDNQLLNTECRNWNQYVACDFTSRNRVIEREQQIQKIHQIFEKLDVRGKIDIKNAGKRFQLVQLHKWTQHHQLTSTQTLQQVYFGVELSSYKPNRSTKFNSKYQLSNRIYLGPTSTDNDLSFLMCNQAHIENGNLVLDPFVGTAGLLIPPAINGAIVFGCDLDMRVLNGYAVGRINIKSNFYSIQKKLEMFTPKIQLNFDQYELPKPNIIRMDCTKSIFAQHTKFDAIITDPPYGIRAMSRSLMKKQQNKTCICQLQQQSQSQCNEIIQIDTDHQPQQQSFQIPNPSPEQTQQQLKQFQKKKQKKEKTKQNRKKRKQNITEQQKKFKQDILEKLSRERIDHWGKFDKCAIADTERQVIFESLLNLARKHLKPRGRLVFLYPIYQDEEFLGIDSLPKHQGFELIDMSRNILSRNTSRILVTLEKL